MSAAPAPHWHSSWEPGLTAEEPWPWHCCLWCCPVSGHSSGSAVRWDGWHNLALQGGGQPQEQAQGSSRASLVATQGYVHGLKRRSVWQQRYGKVLNTSKKMHVKQLLLQEKGTRRCIQHLKLHEAAGASHAAGIGDMHRGTKDRVEFAGRGPLLPSLQEKGQHTWSWGGSEETRPISTE